MRTFCLVENTHSIFYEIHKYPFLHQAALHIFLKFLLSIVVQDEAICSKTTQERVYTQHIHSGVQSQNLLARSTKQVLRCHLKN